MSLRNRSNFMVPHQLSATSPDVNDGRIDASDVDHVICSRDSGEHYFVNRFVVCVLLAVEPFDVVVCTRSWRLSRVLLSLRRLL